MSFLSDYRSGRTPPPPADRSDSERRATPPAFSGAKARPKGKKVRPAPHSRAATLLQDMQGRPPASPSNPSKESAEEDKSRRKDRKAKAPRDRHAPPVPTVSAMEAILRCLARREHSQKELRDRLKRQGHPVDAIEEALSRAVEQGYQSDERFAKSLVRFKGARKGERQLRQLLNQHRLDKDMVEEALEQGEDELTRAVNTLRRFEGKTPDAALRQKATRFMIGRGFGFDVIKKSWKVVFEGADPEDF